jgi:hypothetical protein
MGCSCSKNRRRTATPSRIPTNSRMGSANGRITPSNNTQSLNSQPSLNAAGISAEKRRLQTERRQSIKNKMKRT